MVESRDTQCRGTDHVKTLVFRGPHVMGLRREAHGIEQSHRPLRPKCGWRHTDTGHRHIATETTSRQLLERSKEVFSNVLMATNTLSAKSHTKLMPTSEALKPRRLPSTYCAKHPCLIPLQRRINPPQRILPPWLPSTGPTHYTNIGNDNSRTCYFQHIHATRPAQSPQKAFEEAPTSVSTVPSAHPDINCEARTTRNGPSPTDRLNP